MTKPQPKRSTKELHPLVSRLDAVCLPHLSVKKGKSMTPTTDVGIYRCIEERPDIASQLKKTYATKRPPGNIPYLVDNLWEWKRPDGYPCRRSAAYASPQPYLAQDSGASGCTVFRVELMEGFLLCQLQGYKDSKFHPECKSAKENKSSKSSTQDSKLV
jgi:hypothetical protein